MAGLRQHVATIKHRGREYDIAYSMRQGDDCSILYLHGLGSTKMDFEQVEAADALRGLTLVGFDCPGCGRSTSYYPEIALGIDDLVEMARSLVERLSLENLTVIGHSLGGLVGLQFAHRHPDMVARFVSVEGNLTPTDCEIQSRDVFRRRFLGDEERFFEHVAMRLDDPNKPGFGSFIKELRSNIVDRAYFDYCRSIVDYSDNHPLLAQFLSLPMPKLYIHGSANAHLPHLATLASAGVPVLSVPDSDHFPMLTNPECFFAGLQAFLRTPPRANTNAAVGGRS